MEKLAALKQYFGHSAFRPGQETMVDALLSGRDAFGVMPTGAANRSAISCRLCCFRG